MQRFIPSRQRGFTLLEMTIALVVMAILFIGIWQLIAYLSQQLQDQAVARHTRVIALAALKYTKAQTNIPPNQWHEIDIQTQLKPQYLSNAIERTNIVGHTYHAVVRRVVDNTQNPPLDFAETYVLAVGGPKRYSDMRGTRMASLIGPDGGYLYSRTPHIVNTEVSGAYGGWRLPRGHFAGLPNGIVLTDKDIVASTVFLEASLAGGGGGGGGIPPDDDRYLHRISDPVGDARLRTMETDILMSENSFGGRTGVAHDIVGLSSLEMYRGATPQEDIPGNHGDIKRVRNLEIERGSVNVDGISIQKSTNGTLSISSGLRLSGSATLLNNQFGNPQLSIKEGILDTVVICGVNGSENCQPYQRGPVVDMDLSLPLRIRQAVYMERQSFIWKGKKDNDDGSKKYDKIEVDDCGECSDIRLKKDIQPIKNALENVLKLNGVEYIWKDKNNAWKEDAKEDQVKDIGVIAQEVEKIYPELVRTRDEGFKEVNYGRLVAPLIEAVRELNAKHEQSVKELKAENAALRSELDGLKKKLDSRLPVSK